MLITSSTTLLLLAHSATYKRWSGHQQAGPILSSCVVMLVPPYSTRVVMFWCFQRFGPTFFSYLARYTHQLSYLIASHLTDRWYIYIYVYTCIYIRIYIYISCGGCSHGLVLSHWALFDILLPVPTFNTVLLVKDNQWSHLVASSQTLSSWVFPFHVPRLMALSHRVPPLVNCVCEENTLFFFLIEKYGFPQHVKCPSRKPLSQFDEYSNLHDGILYISRGG